MGVSEGEPSEIRWRAIQFYAGLYSSESVEDDELSAYFYEGLSSVSDTVFSELKRGGEKAPKWAGAFQ